MTNVPTPRDAAIIASAVNHLYLSIPMSSSRDVWETIQHLLKV